MPMDGEISRWILDYLLRQPIDDEVLGALFRVLPISGDSNFNYSMLLRKLQFQISRGSLTEEILELLQEIERLRCREGIRAPESIKEVYCAVAVNCTVRFLEDDGEDKELKYFEAVKKIWKFGVFRMEKTELEGLFSEELKNWGDEIIAAVWDSSVQENLVLKCKEIDGLEMLRAFVAESWKNLGPPFLVHLADSLSDVKVREVLGLSKQVSDDSEQVVQDSPQDSPVINIEKGKGKEICPIRQKHVARSRQSARLKAAASRGAKITYNEEAAADKSEKYGFLETPKIDEMQEALKTSTMDLRAAVIDPLPNAVHVADTLVSEMARNKENVSPPGPSDDNNPTIRPNKNFMEPNSTARADEWDDDSIEASSSEGGRTFSLPTPKKRVISPLKKHRAVKLKKRRAVHRWSSVEEDTLREGVEKYGRGNWKLILWNYRNIFIGRTEVDLKDKWRNMVD